jgi:hypothetical protein
LEVSDGFRPHVFDLPLPVIAEVVEPEAVGRGIDLLAQSMLQGSPLRSIYLNLKHRELNALTEVLAQSRDPPKPLRPTDIRSSDVVTHQNHHRRTSLPEVRRVSIDVAADMAGKELRLQQRQQARGCRFVEKRVSKLLALSVLVSNQDALSRLIRQ